MNKIIKETIFLILCILAFLGSLLSFIAFQEYIPEYFIYINNNWNSGYSGIVSRSERNCKLPFLENTALKFYKNYSKDFFNKESIGNNENIKSEKNIKNYYFKHLTSDRVIDCLDNKTTYFDTILFNVSENTNFEKCKYIDSFNKIECREYPKYYLYRGSTKYTEIVFSQAQPCFDPRYLNMNMTFDKTSYYYDKSKCPGGKTNPHYVQVNNITIRALVEYNKLDELKDIFNDTILDQNIFIYGRNYIGIKDSCRGKAFKELNNVLNEINQYIQSSITWLGYITLLELIFFLLFLNRFIVKYHNYKNNNCNLTTKLIRDDFLNENEDEIRHEQLNKTKELLPPYTKPIILVLSLIILAGHILVFAYFLNISDFIDLFKDTSCFEEEAGELIKPSITYLISGRYIQIITAVINMVLAFKYGIKKGISYAK